MWKRRNILQSTWYGQKQDYHLPFTFHFNPAAVVYCVLSVPFPEFWLLLAWSRTGIAFYCQNLLCSNLPESDLSLLELTFWLSVFLHLSEKGPEQPWLQYGRTKVYVKSSACSVIKCGRTHLLLGNVELRKRSSFDMNKKNRRVCRIHVGSLSDNRSLVCLTSIRNAKLPMYRATARYLACCSSSIPGHHHWLLCVTPFSLQAFTSRLRLGLDAMVCVLSPECLNRKVM